MSASPPDGPLRALFVCRGNICRSPMAAALAQHRFGHQIHAESAGLTPVFDQATQEALAVMEERGLDISGHRSRSIANLVLNSFHLLVALTPAIRDGLPGLSSATSSSAIVVTWDVADPYGGDLNRYRRCAQAIEQALESLDLERR